MCERPQCHRTVLETPPALFRCWQLQQFAFSMSGVLQNKFTVDTPERGYTATAAFVFMPYAVSVSGSIGSKLTTTTTLMISNGGYISEQHNGILPATLYASRFQCKPHPILIDIAELR